MGRTLSSFSVNTIRIHSSPYSLTTTPANSERKRYEAKDNFSYVLTDIEIAMCELESLFRNRLYTQCARTNIIVANVYEMHGIRYE